MGDDSTERLLALARFDERRRVLMAADRTIRAWEVSMPWRCGRRRGVVTKSLGDVAFQIVSEIDNNSAHTSPNNRSEDAMTAPHETTRPVCDGFCEGIPCNGVECPPVLTMPSCAHISNAGQCSDERIWP